MRAHVIGLLAALLGSLWYGLGMAEDLSIVRQWDGKFPLEKAVDDKPLWDQASIQAAMRAAMGERFFALAQQVKHGPEAPVTGDGKGVFVAWACDEPEDCGGNQITAYFNTATGIAQVCWRSSDGIGGKVQDVWLAKGDVRPLAINGCGIRERDPFAPLKKYGGPEGH